MAKYNNRKDFKKLILIAPSQSFKGFSSHSITQFPPLSLGYIAALTPKHWDIEILDENFDGAEIKKCDLVGISIMTSTANRGYQIAKKYNSAGIPVVLGGIHASMVSDEALQFADSVVVGEAENIWPKLISDFEKGSLESIYKASDTVNIASLPHPRHDLFDKRYQWCSVQTSRGCPMDCEFCSVTAFNGMRFRRRPIEPVLNEIKSLPQKFLFFTDDNLMGHSKKDKEFVVELFNRMIKERVNKIWLSQTSLNIAQHDDVLHLARKSGCIGLFVGIESIDDNVLGGKMNKKINIQYLKDGWAIKKIHRNGIAVVGSFIVGNDEDGEDVFNKIYSYAKKSNIDIPTIAFSTPFPGTRLEERLKKQNRLVYRNFPNDWQYYNIGNRAMYDTRVFTRKKMNQKMKQTIDKMFSIPAVIGRGLYSFLYSRNPIILASVIKGNMSYRTRHFNCSYYTDASLR